MSFVVAFNGARDAYQVPLAMYEHHLLTKLVTDFYSPEIARIITKYVPGLEKFKSRYAHGLPCHKVQSNTKLIQLQYLNPLLAQLGIHIPSQYQLSHDGQAILSLAALNIASKTGSNLFLYAGYAYEAFRSPLSTNMIKGVFQYHPHIKLSAEILRQDVKRYPSLKSALKKLEEDEKDPSNIYELMQADFIVCASSFTARSMKYVGVPASKIYIIPYGINFKYKSKSIEQPLSNKICHFLFVGSGIHRKGLHHLFYVWEKLNIPNTYLTVVARKIDPEIAALKPSNNVRILQFQSKESLQTLYNQSQVFILPSLIEGFGYVYLEALSYGCYCIGTNNTGFPDLNCPNYAGETVIAGNIDSLSESIIHAYELFKNGYLVRDEIQNFALNKQWEAFRLQLVDICKKYELN